MVSHRWTGVTYIQAICQTCGWESYERNAMGNAARHSDAYGHSVSVEQCIVVSFLNDADDAARRAERSHA